MIKQAGRRRRVLTRIVVWSAVTFLCLLSFAVLYLYYVPMTGPRLKQRIAAEFARASGVPVEIRAARCFAATGRCEIEGILFKDPEAGLPLLELKSVRLSVRPTALLMGRSAFINTVEIREPTPLRFEYSNGRLHPGAEVRFLRRLADRRPQPDAGKDTKLPFRRFRIVDADVQVIRRDAPGLLPSPDVAHNVPIALRNLTLTVSTETGRPAAGFTGVFTSGGQTAPVEGRVALEGKGTAAVSLMFNRLRVRNSGAVMQNSDLSDVRIDGRVRQSGDTLATTGTVSAAAMAVTRGGDVLRDENLTVDLEASYSTSTAVLTFNNALIRSDRIDTQLAGSYNARDSGFDFRVQTQKIAAEYLEILSAFLPPDVELSCASNNTTFEFDARGSANRLTEIAGRAHLEGCTLTTAFLPKPLNNLTGDITIEPQLIRFRNTDAMIGETSVSLNGTFAGDFLTAREGVLNLDWNAAGSSEDLLLFGSYAGNPSVVPPRMGGNIEGEGHFEQRIAWGENAAVGAPAFEGQIHLSDVSMQHELLPAPITALTGLARINTDELVIESMSGRMQDNQVQIRGRLHGDKLFWKSPELTATVSGKLNLREVFGYLPPEQKKALSEYKITGAAQSTLSFSGPISRPEDIHITGRVKLLNAGFDPRLEFMHGAWQDVNADVLWDGEMLRVESFSAGLNGETVSGSGILSASRISVDLNGSLDLGFVPKTFPSAGRLLEMSGPASYNGRFSVNDSALAGSAPALQPGFGGRLVPLLSLVNLRINEAVAARTFKLDGQVDFGNETAKARIRHNGMPIERTDPDGVKIPRGEMTNISGKAVIRGDTFTIPESSPVLCDFTGAKNSRLSGTIQYRPNDFPKIAFNINAPGDAVFDSWTLGWGKGLVLPPAPIVGDKTFRISGTINARQGIYKSIGAGRVRVKISFEAPQGKPRLTTFEEVTIENAEGGSLQASGSIRSFPWNRKEYPQWHAEARRIENMPLLPMLVWVFRDVSNLDGTASGMVTLDGAAGDPMRTRGSGSISLSNLAIGRTELMQRLGQNIGRSFEGNYFGTAQAAHFEVGNGALTSRDLRLETRGIIMEVRGSYYYAAQPSRGISARALEAMMKINFFESVIGKLPIIGELSRIPDALTGALLAEFRVTGSVDNPQVSPILLPLLQGVTTINQ